MCGLGDKKKKSANLGEVYLDGHFRAAAPPSSPLQQPSGHPPAASETPLLSGSHTARHGAVFASPRFLSPGQAPTQFALCGAQLQAISFILHSASSLRGGPRLGTAFLHTLSALESCCGGAERHVTSHHTGSNGVMAYALGTAARRYAVPCAGQTNTRQGQPTSVLSSWHIHWADGVSGGVHAP